MTTRAARGIEVLYRTEPTEATGKRVASLFVQKQCRPSRQRVVDGEKEARLVALCCSKVPAGRGRWTLRMLADKLVELQIVESISHETVRQVLKKTNCSLGGA